LRSNTEVEIKKDREMIAKLIGCDCKVDLVSGGLAWAPCNWIGNLSWFWVSVRSRGANRLFERLKYFSPHKKCCSGWVGSLENFTQKMYVSQFFVRSGQKIPRSKSYQSLIYCWSEVCSGWVKARPISNSNHQRFYL